MNMARQQGRWVWPAVAVILALAVLGCPPRQDTVTVSPKTATIEVGQTVQLSATSTRNESFSWTSNDTDVATVSSTGLVTGVNFGEATIRATGQNSQQSDTALVTVTPQGDVRVLEEYQEHIAYIGDVGDQLPPSIRESLIDLIQESRRHYGAGRICDAGGVLEWYLDQTQDVRDTAEHQWVAEDLFNRGHRLLADVILSAPTLGIPLDCPEFERIGMESEPEVQTETQTRVLSDFRFSEPIFDTVVPPDMMGEVFTEFHLPAVQSQSDVPGLPGIPAVRRLIAVPQGQAFEIELSVQEREARRYKMNLYPFQVQPRDQVNGTPPDELPPPEHFGDQPFVMDEKIYNTDAFWPPELATITPLGQYRDLELALLEVYSGQYNPVSQELRLFDGVVADVVFPKGDEGFYLSQATRSPFESKREVYIEAVLNRNILETAPLLEWLKPQLVGEEFMILTHPTFRDAADRLAAHKNARGLVTNVFECGTGSGVSGRETREEIKAFIQNRYHTVALRPSYILLLGDAEFISPWYVDGIYGSIGTDWRYATLDYEGHGAPPLVPSFAVGRIPVDTLAQADIVIDKIIEYESNPPGSPSISGHPFYNNITIAAQFQCCRLEGLQGRAQRTFTEVSEFVGTPLRNMGYNVQRIYRSTVAGNYTGDPTPRRYYDGTPLPPALAPGSGFAWNGSTSDVINAFNAGRFLIMHRDHGWSGGWGTPSFTTSNIGSLNHAPYFPVVYSINCASGYFDNETALGGNPSAVYWGEALLRRGQGGAVGIIGDTRDSPSWPNTALTRGLFDATWPSVVPTFGSNVSKRRLGDILNHAKLYLITQIGVEKDTNINSALSQMALWHVFGDPTLEMWTSDPWQIQLPLFFEALPLQQGVRVFYETEGSVLTAYQTLRGEIRPIGRAVVQDGAADIDYFIEPMPDLPIEVSAGLENAIAVQLEELPQ